MNRCETCKHRSDDHLDTVRWDEDGNDLPITYYECKRVTHGNDGYGAENYKPGEQALVTDGSGYIARFVVENTFGCVLWKSK